MPFLHDGSAGGYLGPSWGDFRSSSWGAGSFSQMQGRLGLSGPPAWRGAGAPQSQVTPYQFLESKSEFQLRTYLWAPRNTLAPLQLSSLGQAQGLSHPELVSPSVKGALPAPAPTPPNLSLPVVASHSVWPTWPCLVRTLESQMVRDSECLAFILLPRTGLPSLPGAGGALPTGTRRCWLGYGE